MFLWVYFVLQKPIEMLLAFEKSSWISLWLCTLAESCLSADGRRVELDRKEEVFMTPVPCA